MSEEPNEQHNQHSTKTTTSTDSETSDQQTTEETEDDALREQLRGSSEVKICGVSVQRNTVTCLQLSVLFVLLLIAGGGIFHAIEHPHELKRIEKAKEDYNSDKEQILKILYNYNSTHDDNDVERTYSILKNHSLGFSDGPNDKNQWIFSNSFIFSFTIVTTIGYGTFAPETRGGQMFLIIYALIGIPIAGLSLGFIAERALYVFTWMSKVGTDKAEEAFRHFDEDSSGELDKDEFKAAVKMLGFNLKPSEFEKLWTQVDADGGGTVDLDEFREAIEFMHADVTEAAGQKNKVIITLVGIIAWILIGVLMFSLVEDWRPNKTFYFVFVSLTTIGLGDVFPKTIVGQGFLVVFAMVGLGLVAVLFTLLETMFSEMDEAKEKTLKKEKEKKDNMILLKQIPIFAAMTDDEIDRILEKTNTIEFGPNIDIIKEGTEIDLFYILMSGRVIISEINSAEKQEVSAPSFLLESALLENLCFGHSNVTVRSIDDEIRVLELSRGDFEEIWRTKAKNLEAITVQKDLPVTKEILKDINIDRLLDRENFYLHRYSIDDLRENKKRTSTFIW